MSGSIKKTGKGWVAESPMGEAVIRFSEPNAHGVLDHWVTLPGKPENYMPLRMLPNGEGTEVELALFRLEGMADAEFEDDAGLIEKESASLKTVLEKLR